MEILKIISDNPTLLEAVKKTILKQFDTTTISIMKIDKLGDKAIGELVRAQIAGVKAVEEAFREIERYKTVSDQPLKVNPGK